MTKLINESPCHEIPCFCICEQQKCRSATLSTQADRRLCLLLYSRIPLDYMTNWSVDAQPGLCLTWTETLKTDFLMTLLMSPLFNSFIIVKYCDNHCF